MNAGRPGDRACEVTDQQITVVVVDDDALVRGALTMMLDGAEGIAVVGEAADGDDVPALVCATNAEEEPCRRFL